MDRMTQESFVWKGIYKGFCSVFLKEVLSSEASLENLKKT